MKNWKEDQRLQALKIAEHKYGVENVSIENISGVNNLLIKMPDFTMSNSFGHTHEIKGLYFGISDYGERCNCFREFSSYQELLKNYWHSHYSGSQWSNSAYFCLGNTPISSLWGKLYKTFNEDDFELFLEYVDSYLMWESLEGTPFINMNSLAVGGTIIPFTLTPAELQTAYKTYRRFIQENDQELSYKVEGNDVKFFILPNNKLEKVIADKLPKILNYYDESNNLVTNIISSSEKKDIDYKIEKYNKSMSRARITFKGKDVVNTCLPYNGICDTSSFEFRCNDEARKQIYKIVNDNINTIIKNEYKNAITTP